MSAQTTKNLVIPNDLVLAGPRNVERCSHKRSWIGLVERFACTLAIIFGQVTLIAVVVAVKGLGRFKELTTPKTCGRFVLGTLVSLTWACTLGFVGAKLVL